MKRLTDADKELIRFLGADGRASAWYISIIAGIPRTTVRDFLLRESDTMWERLKMYRYVGSR